MRNVVTMVLGGGRGTRLYPLTKFRSKPAVPLAGKYRLIDIPLSNCINSGLRRIFVLTQFMSVSLHRHIRQTYRFDHFSGGFIEILAAQQTMDQGTDWYQGTADAVRKNMRYLKQPGIDYVLILSGDQLYRMNYREMLRTHMDAAADATIAALPVTREQSSGLGVMRVDDKGQVIEFVEKPTSNDQLDKVAMESDWFEARGVPSAGRECIASMGIYLFNRDTLVEMLESDHEDFGKEVFPAAINNKRVCVHLFDGYWRDIGTIRSFFEANLAMAKLAPPFNLYVPESPVYSRQLFLPPSRFDGAQIKTSMIADGCKIAPGAHIENSLIGLRCVIGEGANIRDSILMGADEYESEQQRSKNRKAALPNIGVGEGATIIGTIVDKNCRIGNDVVIQNSMGVNESEVNEFCLIRDGIPVIAKEAVVPDGWKVGS